MPPGDLTMRLPDVVVRTIRQSAGTVIPPHAHETTNIGVCVRGSFLETVGRRPVTMTPATLVVRPAGEVHENRFASDARYIVVEMQPGAVARFRAMTDVLDRASTRDSAFVTTTVQRLDRELRQPDVVSPLVVESLVYELVADAHRASASRREALRHRPDWLARAIEMLDGEHPGTGFAGLGALAARVDVHAAQLARAFRRELGCSVGEYVRARNLAEAARLLRTSRLDLVEVAHAVGYSDQSHFSTAFRRQFGVTPGHYRRTFRAR